MNFNPAYIIWDSIIILQIFNWFWLYKHSLLSHNRTPDSSNKTNQQNCRDAQRM